MPYGRYDGYYARERGFDSRQQQQDPGIGNLVGILLESPALKDLKAAIEAMPQVTNADVHIHFNTLKEKLKAATAARSTGLLVSTLTQGGNSLGGNNAVVLALLLSNAL